jgi:hypothetical protein
MSSLSLFPSLGALQSSFAAGLSGFLHRGHASLDDLRQVPAFSGFSSLDDLVSRMPSPSRF